MTSLLRQGARQGILFTIFIASLAVVVCQTQHGDGLGILEFLLNGKPIPSGLKHDQWSLTTITSAYRTYKQVADTETQKMRTSYNKLSTALRRASSSLNYLAKLDRLDQATLVNSAVAGAIADLATRELGVNATEVDKRSGAARSVFRTREVFLHFVRDWSEEGKEEREVIFEPILRVLEDVPKDGRGGMRVLVPGAGLGRLAWEISQLGTSHVCFQWLHFYHEALWGDVL